MQVPSPQSIIPDGQCEHSLAQGPPQSIPVSPLSRTPSKHVLETQRCVVGLQTPVLQSELDVQLAITPLAQLA
jgi:hypothetical protein